jgi:hypothetical protein
MSGLKPCKPGETHNPNGRPVGSTSIKTKLKRLLASYRPPKDVYNEMKKKYPQIAKYEDCTIDDAIWVRVLDQAQRGNESAREFVADRTEGKVKETLRIEEDDPVTMHFTFEGVQLDELETALSVFRSCKKQSEDVDKISD